MIRRIIREPATEAVNAFWSGDSVVVVAPGGGMKRHKAEFSCFLRTAEVTQEVARHLRSSRAVAGTTVEGEWMRVRWRDPELREVGCRWLEEKASVPTYEGNVNPVRRWLIENNVKVMPPRACYLDLETDPRPGFKDKERMRILAWAVIDAVDWKTKHYTGVLNEDTDRDEKRLLLELWRLLAEYDQVIGWNLERFDFPVLAARTKEREIAVPIRRPLWLDHMNVFQRMNVMAAESGDEKQSFALDAIARAVLGESEGKLALDASRAYHIWQNDEPCITGECMDCRDCLVKYCLHDTTRMPKIEAETGYIALLGTLCDVCGIFPDSRAVNPQGQVETFMLRLARKRDYRPRTRLENKDEARDKFRGAYVMEPRGRGITKDVHVADFKSMYPSIILTWNMSPETKRAPLPDPTAGLPAYLSHLRKPWTVEEATPPGCASSPGTGAMFDQGADGILPAMVSELMKLRKHWSDIKAKCAPGTPEWKDADRRTTAYKIAVNSCFGVTGAPTSIFFDRTVAESITQAGKWLAEQVIEAAEARGIRVIYFDTDGLYATGCTDAEFTEFVRWCNEELFPSLTSAQRCARNTLKISYEKKLERIVFVAAKKYAARWAAYEGTAAAADSEPEVKGLEYKRGDSVKLARVLQKQVVDLLMSERCEEPERFSEVVVEFRRRVLEGELSLGDVLQSKRLTRGLGAYKMKTKKDGTPAAQQPHVMIAHQLKKRGRDVGEGAKIEYFCVDGSTSPKKYQAAEDWAGECDRHELWESLVYPATERLLEGAFPGQGWATWGVSRPPKQRSKAAKAPTSNLPRGDDGPLFRAMEGKSTFPPER